MLRFGIMGAGHIAAKFCAAARLVEEVEVVAVASKDAARARQFAADNGVEASYGDYALMLEQGGVDVVYIATTGNFHYENIMLSLKHQKHVLCEKAMVETAREAQAIFAEAKERQCFVMEAMWSRFLPAVRKAKEWVAQGRIGPVQIATYTGGINPTPDHRIFNKPLGGGAMYDLLVYPVEIVTYIVNQRLVDMQSHLRFGEKTGVDEMCSLLLQFETCDATLQCATHARIPSPSGFYGPKGYIRMEKTHMTTSCDLYDGEFQLVEHFNHPFDNGFEFQIAEVRDCVAKGLLESPIMPWADTLQCAEIFDRCLAQAKEQA